MRIHPDRQTLILAGEPLPKRSAPNSSGVSAVSGRGTGNSPRVTYISARIDAVVTDGEITDAEYTPSASVANSGAVADDASDISNVANDSALPATTQRTALSTSRAYSAFASSSRGSVPGGASAYARTRDLSERHPIIDTYA